MQIIWVTLLMLAVGFILGSGVAMLISAVVHSFWGWSWYAIIMAGASWAVPLGVLGAITSEDW